MATIGNSCFWLVDKKSSVESLGQMNQNLVCINFVSVNTTFDYATLLYLAKWFQRRTKNCRMAAMFVYRSEQNEQS
jgi:hypothetical protein